MPKTKAALEHLRRESPIVGAAFGALGYSPLDDVLAALLQSMHGHSAELGRLLLSAIERAPTGIRVRDGKESP